MGLQQNQTKIDKKKGTFTLSCSASADPKPEMIWKKDGKVLRGREDDHVMKPTGKPNVYVSDYELLITEDQDQAGLYSCTAMNLGGSDTSATDVVILGELMVLFVLTVLPITYLALFVWGV